MKVKKLIFFIILSLFTNLAFAKFYLEPFGGILFSGVMDSSINTEDSVLIGNLYGARFGTTGNGLFFGVGSKLGSLTLDSNTVGVVNQSLALTQYSLCFGMNFASMLRLWGEYVLSSTAEHVSGTFSGSSGTSIGIGYMPLSFLAFNIEMSSFILDRFQTTAGVESAVDQKYSYFLFSASFPLSI